MCLAKAYLKTEDKKELFLEGVAFVEVGDKRLLLTTILREQREIEADIRAIDFANSSIILERTGSDFGGKMN